MFQKIRRSVPSGALKNLFSHGKVFNSSQTKRKFGTLLAMTAACGSAYGLQAIHSAASGEKQLFAWGSNQYGQLGLGDETNRQMPNPVDCLAGLNVVQASAGGECGIAVTATGEVYTWGRGDDFALGHGDDSNVNFPRLVEELLDHNVVYVSCSRTHACAITDKGELYSWGNEAVGREGSGARPALVQGSLTGKKVKMVSCGGNHTLAVTDDGRLHSWGTGYHGALGTGGVDAQSSPVLVDVDVLKDKKVVNAAAGRGFSVILTDAGEVLTCGVTDYGQTGHGSDADRYMKDFKSLRALTRQKIADIDAGDYHAVACTRSGRVYTWGMGGDGQMGTGTKDLHNTFPSLVPALSKNKIVRVGAGGGHTTALDANGKLFIWGRGRDGQIGRADSIESMAAYRDRPVEVVYFAKHGLKVEDVCLGADFSMALAI